jgi:hypothetical protein
MKPDAEYYLKLLTAFQDGPNGTTDVRELGRAGFSLNDPKFAFHMQLGYDDGFISSDLGGIGLDVSADGHKQWSVIPLRLTAAGHAQVEAVSSVGPVGKIGFDY